jgi:hypothetical protein
MTWPGDLPLFLIARAERARRAIERPAANPSSVCAAVIVGMAKASATKGRSRRADLNIAILSEGL